MCARMGTSGRRPSGVGTELQHNMVTMAVRKGCGEERGCSRRPAGCQGGGEQEGVTPKKKLGWWGLSEGNTWNEKSGSLGESPLFLFPT